MRRRQSLAALAAFTLAGTRYAVAQEKRQLRAGGASNDVIKPLYYAQRSGIFAKLGLTVDILPMNNGAASAAALIGGDLDVASVSILTPLQAHQKGIPMRILSPSLWDTSDKATIFSLVLKDAPFHTARDMNGKTFGGAGLADLSVYGIYAWLDRNGGDSKSVRVIEVPPSAALAFLEQGRADVVTMIEPFASQALASGKVRILMQPLDSISPRFEGAAYVVMEPAVAKNFDAMSRLARGLHEATVYTNEHLAETVGLVASYTGATPEVVAKMNRVTDPEFVDARNIQPIIDTLAKYGALERGFPASDVISSAALKPPR